MKICYKQRKGRSYLGRSPTWPSPSFPLQYTTQCSLFQGGHPHSVPPNNKCFFSELTVETKMEDLVTPSLRSSKITSFTSTVLRPTASTSKHKWANKLIPINLNCDVLVKRSDMVVMDSAKKSFNEFQFYLKPCFNFEF